MRHTECLCFPTRALAASCHQLVCRAHCLASATYQGSSQSCDVSLGRRAGAPFFFTGRCGRWVLPRLGDATVRQCRLERHVQDMFIHILTVLWLEKQEPYRTLVHLDSSIWGALLEASTALRLVLTSFTDSAIRSTARKSGWSFRSSAALRRCQQWAVMPMLAVS